MAVGWAREAAELLVALERSAPEGLGHQLQEQIRSAVRSGRLRPGERLPSTRRLAEEAGISRGLVVTAYEQLRAEGYLEAATGSATRVAAGAVAPSQEPEARPGRPDVPPPGPAVASFEYGVPDAASFPMTDWLWALTAAARSMPGSAMGDEIDAGSARLREVVTSYHRRVRAGCAAAEDAVITNGFRQGLSYVMAVLARRGVTHIALEDPGPRDHDLLAARHGLRVVPVPVDQDGLDVESLRGSAARAVVVTPAHQSPTGVLLSPARRRQLVAWAGEKEAVIIEDDYDAEFRYDRQPVGSLQGLAPDRVLALGSVSKTLAPALKIGWILAPAALLPALLEEKRLTSRGVPVLDQLALAELMETGRFDRHLRRMRAVYGARRDTLVRELGVVLPGLRVTGLAAGCHALLGLPDHVDERAVVEAARARGVEVRGLGDYRVRTEQAAGGDTRFGPALVLGFGNLNESRIRRGSHELATAIDAVS